MSKRINIVLPDKTVAVLDRVAAKGTPSKRRAGERCASSSKPATAPMPSAISR